MTGARATFEYRIEYASFSVQVHEGPGATVERFEAALDHRAVPLPLYHRSPWLKAFASARSLVLCVASPDGPEVSFAAEVERSRVIPGHRILRVRRLGSAVNPTAVLAGLRALQDTVAGESRILRIHVELFNRDPIARAACGRQLREFGYRLAVEPRSYRETIVIELQGDESTLFESLHRTARRKLRALDRDPLSVRPVVEQACAKRLQELVNETMARTGGTVPRPAWDRLIALGVEHPSRLRILGSFPQGVTDPDSLLAFALMLRHGDHVEYSWSGSTRRTDVRAPLAHGLIWHGMLWAREQGASWFDFGGITSGSAGDGSDPLGGISDFKRSFGKTVVAVGEEWVFEPHALRAAVAGAVNRVAGRIREAKRRWSRTG